MHAIVDTVKQCFDKRCSTNLLARFRHQHLYWVLRKCCTQSVTSSKVYHSVKQAVGISQYPRTNGRLRFRSRIILIDIGENLYILPRKKKGNFWSKKQMLYQQRIHGVGPIDHSDNKRGNLIEPFHGLLFLINSKEYFICTNPLTMAFVTLVIDLWMEHEISQCVHKQGSIPRHTIPRANTLPLIYVLLLELVNIAFIYLKKHSTHFNHM